MISETYQFLCAPNGHVFTAPEADAYGEFVMRSIGDRLPAVLSTFDDPVFDEVDEILKEHGIYQKLESSEQTDILQNVFGVACDPAPDGTQYMIGLSPKCPICGSVEMRSWERTTPAQLFTGSVRAVSHDAWNALGRETKHCKLRLHLDGTEII